MLKKLALGLLGVIGGIVAVVNVGSIVALALSVGAALVGLHYFRRSISNVSRVFWGIVLVAGILTGISNIPAFIGLLAAAAAYYVWRNWDRRKREMDPIIEADPFMKFEKQWNEFTK